MYKLKKVKKIQMTATLKLRLLDYLLKKTRALIRIDLVELIVVVVIIGILSSIAVPAFRNATKQDKRKLLHW